MGASALAAALMPPPCKAILSWAKSCTRARVEVGSVEWIREDRKHDSGIGMWGEGRGERGNGQIISIKSIWCSKYLRYCLQD